MSNILKYMNEFGTEISPTQADQLDFYSITLIDDNNNKYIESYSGGKYIGTTYFITSLNEINEHLQTDPNASFQYSYLLNNYAIIDQLSYSGAELTLKRRFVSNTSGNLICVQDYDVVSGSPKYLTTRKHYYDESGEEIFEFVYNGDGSCFSVDQVQIIDTDAEFLASEIGVNPDLDFTWEGLEYYRNAEPLVPTN